MAVPSNQKEYLKRYLSNDVSKKKKKKSKKSTTSAIKGIRMIEETGDLKDIPFGFVDEDDAPTIAEVTYDDDHLKHLEDFDKVKNMWKKMNSESQKDEINLFSHSSENPISLKSTEKNITKPTTPNQRKRQKHDADPSPAKRQRDDSDASSPRTQRHDLETSPPRKQRHDSETSPPRKQRHDSETSPPMKQRHDLETSPPRKQRHDSDTSPPRKQRHDSDTSPPMKQRHDSDTSPPRKQRHDSDTSPPRKQRHDSDTSPPRRQRHDSDTSPPRKQRHDSDTSPPRKQRHDSDTSPPRRQRHDSDASPPRRQRDDSGANSNKASISTDRKMTTKEFLNKRKFGKSKDTPEDVARKEREAELQSQVEEKYKHLNRGVKQLKQQEERIQNTLHEMSKPLARYEDDKDRNDLLKAVERQDDPMLNYMREKKKKENKQPLFPLYKGSYPPNRFNIAPGYRWDGVDRSNGFEKQRFEFQCNKKADNEESYKWSCVDM